MKRRAASSDAVARTGSARDAIARRELMQLVNVGPATADDLLLLGIRSLDDLRGRDGFDLYDALCRKTRERHDPCVIDVFLALVDHANGAPERPWWKYTAERKRLTARRAAGKSSR